MEPEQGSHIPIAPRGSIPRVSRLPMPRAVASSDNLKLTVRNPAMLGIHQDDLRKTSYLPRPTILKEPLGEAINQSIRSRYGWSDNPVKERSTSPVRDALRDAQGTSLETTPPASIPDPPFFEDGNENPTVGKKDDGAQEHKEKKRPRPSLSERTMETLAQVSPCPTPQRRTSLFGNDSKMPPPLRPASSMRESRPTTPKASRSDSPTRRPFRPPGRISPTKDMVALPPVISPDDIYTPPRAFVRGQRSRIGKPLQGPRRSISSTLEARSQDAGAELPMKFSAQTVKIKRSQGGKTSMAEKPSLRPSLSSIFQDRSSKKESGGSLVPSITDTRPILLKPRPRGEPTIASSTSPSALSKKTKPTTATERDQRVATAQGSHTTSSPKSSAALREAVAKAKAARRIALVDSGSPHTTPVYPSGSPAFVPASSNTELTTASDNNGLLQKRIQQASTTGQLSIAGMNLKRIPAEVMKIYDADNSTINWFEMVDMVKLNAADNEIDELEDHFFPDYTASELADDDEKSNMFGGLQLIDLYRNHLHQLPIGMRRLEKLQTLNLSNNRLTKDAVDIACQIPQLRELMIGENLIDGALSFNGNHLKQLQVLDLHGNQIERLNGDGLSQLRSLKVLNVAGNKLTMLPWELLSTLPLTELNISNNQLSGILFKGTSPLQRLRRLDASHNKLEGVSEAELELPDLRSLVLDGNRISELPDLTRCKELQILGVAENQLNDIPPTLVRLESLKSADFGHNNIRLINPGVASMKSLSSLNLAGNPLREKKYITMTTTDLKMDLNKKLATTPTETEPSDAARIAGSSNHSYRYKPSGGILDLSSQSLTAISPEAINLCDSEAPIHTLKLSNNELSEFPTTLLSHPALKYSLQSLDLSHNPLLHPTDYLGCELFLPNLKSLYIVSTGLTSLDALTTYLKAPCLRELNISCHRLTGRVPWVRAWWPSCHTLLATDNWFTSVEVEGVRGLEVLDIRNNEIESLPPKIGFLGSLSGTAKAPGRLRVLEVSGNKFRVPRLSVIEKGTEAVLKDLRRMVPEQEVPEEWQDII
ncbi:hypothetical protein A1O3_05233 [Capronia epimyces CBS 606.96]|uniref:Leucine-rich repeat-containing protein 40 n=1 Tax=Capronia epimyces CBS 606.96 TaxID=1182542 RepID=W9YQL8_9EURO|nr:uncharacterized protein A1O3_05233 [Capronia epimyces CBS 606.96]EXJ84564.1 hypothetical protein A1O3_05233 [Capronia epimyces CBS 606.96]